ncbi:hypothetical protein [Kushneria phosphatilytica]|uniref:Uncharacterized protein n=1 Tax=Kushneria phosphatilytica TaxID=657387 RepID=A0A1S1NQJ4_9GAMM|nr:hypothetical protein [Kushneria phosphatilytica]OHV10889.1 hypothetical protein BH688_08325 [Kushneria phosphatilytica]QEL12027.1 hypothetical protein FY550_13345 [Kushneria phosphatilytica]
MHKKRQTTALIGSAIAGLTLAGCTGPLFGPGGFDDAKMESSAPPALVKQFHQADADGNGEIDPTEASTAGLRAQFTQLDLDQDRNISEDEFLSGMQELNNNNTQ